MRNYCFCPRRPHSHRGWAPLLAALAGAFGICLSPLLAPIPAVAAELELRLVAADRPRTNGALPPVSDLVDFRRSPDSGLLATQWLSGVTLGDRALFPLTQTSRAPARPTPRDEPQAKPKSKLESDDLLAELKRDSTPAPPRAIAPVDVIDELYRGKVFSDGSQAGAQRARASTAVVDLAAPATLAPGGSIVRAGEKVVEIPAYPVTFTVIAAADGSAASFIPQLTWRGRDLLADCLFEHSPDLPLGDLPGNQTPPNLEARWAALQGGNRLFRRLTVYLPATGTDAEPYWIDGHPFTLTANGVALATGKSRTAKARPGELRVAGKFSLEIVQAPATAAPAKTRLVTVLPSLPPGWKLESPATLTLAPGAPTLDLTLTAPNAAATILPTPVPATPDDPQAWNFFALVTATQTTPVAHCVAVHRPGHANPNQLELRIAATVPVPTVFSGELLPWSDATVTRTNPATPLSFRLTPAGHHAAMLPQLPAGLHRLTLAFAPADSGLPVIIADRPPLGAVTLATYHNRSDFLRGEQIPLALILRATHALESVPGTLALHDDTGTRVSLGQFELQSPADQTRTLFATVPTDSLEPGRYHLTLEAPGVLAHPLEFTLHTHVPRTTFALHSWMPASFSGPVRVGGEVLANCLLDQKPSAVLTPAELAAHAAQGPLDARFRDLFAADKLFPAPERTQPLDRDTELEMAIAMRLGLRHAPNFGWGLNDQEAAWNPKHTLPAELDRMRRLCTQVTQRHRAFGNFAGLHLNWYPTYGGYWEQQPPRDGNARARGERLSAEAAQLHLADHPADAGLDANQSLDLATLRAKYHTAALPRAYRAWTAQARALRPGLFGDDTALRASARVDQPGLSPDAPIYSSFLPVSWFDQHRYHPSVYFSGLPAATVHAYTDYGFSPFQHVWSLDHWTAGVGDKPRWLTSMSNGRDILLGQALLAVARGADGLDLHGDSPATSAVLARFLTAHGPFFRALRPESDVAILSSLRQQVAGGKLVGRWMGYTGGDYFDLYTKLWYARRPAALLPEEDVSPEKLKSFKAVFVLGQQARLPEPAMRALAQFTAAGGIIYKDKQTAADFPGRVFELVPQISDGKKLGRWDGVKYQATRDQNFVGTLAAYEAVAAQLEQLLAPLGPPRVATPTHEVLTAALAGADIAAAVVVNDTHPPPGIVHPWNFWSATIMATHSQLLLDKPYFTYDLLAGGTEARATPTAGGRFALPVNFERCAGRAYVLTESPLRALSVSAQTDANGELTLSARVTDDQQREFQSPLPCEITRLAAPDQVLETLYRALGPKHSATLPFTSRNRRSASLIRVRELASGLTAELHLAPPDAPPPPLTAQPVLTPRPGEVRAFFANIRQPTGPAPKPVAAANPGVATDFLTAVELPDDARELAREILLVLDPRQLARDPALREHAQQFTRDLRARGIAPDVSVLVADPLEMISVTQRWQPTARDRAWQAEALAGRRILVAETLDTRYQPDKRGNTSVPDYLHPWSGYGEPGARHRVHRHVILLGTAAANRLLADLDSTLEMRASENLPAPGSALVHVVHDAFVPRYHVLTIQAHDPAGLLAGMRAVLATAGESRAAGKASESTPAPTLARAPARARASAASFTAGPSATKTPLPNVIETLFGAAVSPVAFTADGGLLASAATQAANYFRFDSTGKLTHHWLGKYGLQPAASPGTVWLHDWWGAPGWLGKIIRADGDARPQWSMSAPNWSGSFQGWHHPGSRWLADPAGDDLFIAGHHLLSRVTAAGKVLWQYDDLTTSHDVESFRFSRDLMLHDVSRDGRHLLVAAFGVVPYARFVSSFSRPSVLLLDARTGKTLWEKSGVLIDHSACNFAGEKILLADATTDAKRIALLDLQGRELWSLARPQGTARAALTPDGTRLIVSPEALRDRNHQLLAPPEGLQSITLADRTTRDFPLTDAVAHWVMLADGRVLVNTRDGRLRCFTPDTRLAWEQQFPEPCNLLAAPDGRQIALGTPTGQLRWLDATGKILREFDVNPFNVATNLTAHVREYTASPAGAPVVQPTPDAPDSLDQRARATVDFSANLLDAKSSAALLDTGLKSPASFPLQLAAHSTHVLSLIQRSAGGLPTTDAERLAVEVRDSASGKILYAARVTVSAAWQERTLSWKTGPAPTRATVTLRHEPPAGRPAGLELRKAGVFRVNFPSPNRLAQRLPDAAADPLATTRATPPSVRFFLPNDVDLAARARGAPPFPPAVGFTVPFDGQIDGAPTSWLGRPLTGSTHARLELKYDRPVKLAALAVYEDSADPARYTDTYAVFVRDARRGQWRQAGHVTGNRSPYNLFTFPAVEADAVTYLWLRSPDGHARIAELEAYSPPADLLE